MKRCIICLALVWPIAPVNASEPSEPPTDQTRVRISATLTRITVLHNGEKMFIARNQDSNNVINPKYAKTSRACPPFCIQPAKLAQGVETIAELELLAALQDIGTGTQDIMVIDSRTPGWVADGTIPGSINIPWTELKPEAGADPFQIGDVLEQRFGVENHEGLLDFSKAKTLIFFCNGPWCGQSPANIKTLLRFGYPAHKIKWYRGGMQAWESLGLTVVR